MGLEREQFVNELMGWRGTPFRHKARLKGIGCDCVGLVVGACQAVGIPVTDMKNYPRFPIHGIFNQMVDLQTDEVALCDVLPGDLLKFKWTTEPQHIAVVISIAPLRIIHAYSQVGMCVINDFDVTWQARFTDARRLKVFA